MRCSDQSVADQNNKKVSWKFCSQLFIWIAKHRNISKNYEYKQQTIIWNDKDAFFYSWQISLKLQHVPGGKSGLSYNKYFVNNLVMMFPLQARVVSQRLWVVSVMCR